MSGTENGQITVLGHMQKGQGRTGHNRALGIAMTHMTPPPHSTPAPTVGRSTCHRPSPQQGSELLLKSLKDPERSITSDWTDPNMLKDKLITQDFHSFEVFVAAA